MSYGDHQDLIMDTLVPTRVRWILVVCITLMAAIFFVDRVNVSIAGHSIARAYDLSDVQLGKIFSAFYLGYGFSRFPPAGSLTGWAPGACWLSAPCGGPPSRRSPRDSPTASRRTFLIIWSVRFFMGMGGSVMFPSSNRWVANWIPTDGARPRQWIDFRRRRRGLGLCPPILRYLMVHLGWRASFWGCGVLGFAAAAAWYWMARNHPDQHSLVE